MSKYIRILDKLPETFILLNLQKELVLLKCFSNNYFESKISEYEFNKNIE